MVATWFFQRLVARISRCLVLGGRLVDIILPCLPANGGPIVVGSADADLDLEWSGDELVARRRLGTVAEPRSQPGPDDGIEKPISFGSIRILERTLVRIAKAAGGTPGNSSRPYSRSTTTGDIAPSCW